MERSSLREIRLALLLIIFCKAFYMPLLCYAGGPGGYGGAFLRAPVGAAALSLGGAMTASPEYLYTWWNPAAQVKLHRRAIVLGTGYRVLGRTEGYFSVEHPIPPRVGMAFSMLYRGDPFVDDLVDEQEYQLDDCSYTTFSFKLGLSYLIRRNFSFGLNFGFFYQNFPTDYTEQRDIIYSSNFTIGGFDIGLYYTPIENLSFGIVLKNIMTVFNWELSSSVETMGLNTIYEDTIPASITFGQQLKMSLFKKPFIWSYDIIGAFLNGNFKALDHSYAVVNNGFEWQRWEIFFIRVGLRDIQFNSDIIHDKEKYWDTFTYALSAGFSFDLAAALKKNRNMTLNYGIANSKVGAGIDQQLDFVVGF